MRFSFVLALLLLLVVPAQAAPPGEGGPDADAPAAAKDGQPDQAAEEPADGTPPSEEEAPPEEDAQPEDDPPEKPSEAVPPEASVPSPEPPGLPRKRAKRLQGVIVVAASEAAEAAAKALARGVYADRALRPAIDEASAQVLVGAVPKAGDAARQELAEVVASIRASDKPTVRRRLLSSLGRDLGAKLVVIVAIRDDGTAEGRPLRLPDEEYAGVIITGQKRGEAWSWQDGLAMLRGLLDRPAPPGPRAPPAPAPTTAPGTLPDDEEDDSWAFLSSPWFWGGLGVVVTVGVTVLVLSQTALNEPDVVVLDGRVGP